jgi:hypothetical protein
VETPEGQGGGEEVKFNGTRCDECGRIKETANHWHRIGVFTVSETDRTLELGTLHGPPTLPYGEDGSETVTEYDVHDLCGDQCFYKHIGKLLKLNPASEAA